MSSPYTGAPLPTMPPPLAPPVRRRSGVVVLCITLAIGLIICAVSGVVRYHNLHRKPAPSYSLPPGALVQPTGIADQLGWDLKSHDQAAFLSHFTGPALKTATQYWQNMDALGFDYGAVGLVNDAAPKDSANGVEFHLSLGVHHSNAAVVPGASDGEVTYTVPGVEYDAIATPIPHSPQSVITTLTPLYDVPWTNTTLHVKKTPNVTVAGLPGEAAFVDAQAAELQKAANWTLKFLGVYHQPKQKGFVVFVSQDAKTRASWFRPIGSLKQPQGKGWVADPSQIGGTYDPLPHPTSLDSQLASAAGGYVVLGAGGTAATTENECTDVHEFTHDVMSAYDLWSYGPAKPVPAWVVEGYARLIEAYCYATPGDPLAKKQISAKPFLARSLQAPGHPAFTGTMPTDAQIYGGSATAGNYYYALGASAFEYLLLKYGDDIGFATAVSAYIGGSVDGPFSEIEQSSSGGTITFYPPDQIRAQWAAWYRGFYGA